MGVDCCLARIWIHSPVFHFLPHSSDPGASSSQDFLGICEVDWLSSCAVIFHRHLSFSLRCFSSTFFPNCKLSHSTWSLQCSPRFRVLTLFILLLSFQYHLVREQCHKHTLSQLCFIISSFIISSLFCSFCFAFFCGKARHGSILDFLSGLRITSW